MAITPNKTVKVIQKLKYNIIAKTVTTTTNDDKTFGKLCEIICLKASTSFV